MTMRMYGFWRSLASFRVRIVFNLKGIPFEELPVDLLKGDQHQDQYRRINPQGMLPAVVDGDGPPLFQSMAILEYLDETHPQPPLLPKDPRDRARVRGIALITAADGHPLVVPRIRNYLEHRLKLDEPARNAWLQHWMVEALKAMEANLANDPRTGTYCHRDQITLADIGLFTHMIGAKLFGCDLSKDYPAATRVFDACMKQKAFSDALPLKQPGAPATPPAH